MKRLQVGMAALLMLSPRMAEAQTAQPFSIQGSALVVLPSGSAFDFVKSGIGAELQIRRNISAFSIGGGVQFSRHDVEGADGMTLVGAFLEPRYVLPLGGAGAPYLSGRLAGFQQRFESRGATANATGIQVNAGGGLLFRVSSAVNLDVGATVGYLKFGELAVQFPGGGNFTAEGGSGTNVVFRAGLAIGLGGR